MEKITQSTLPPTSALAAYAGQPGVHTDCFKVLVSQNTELSTFIEAFFSTLPFRLERLLLRIAGVQNTSHADLIALASGQASRFAAWEVEHRDTHQVLLSAGQGVIRTWLMAAPAGHGATRLHFGSGVLPTRTDAQGTPRLGRITSALMGFHTLYSRILLWSAARRITQQKTGARGL